MRQMQQVKTKEFALTITFVLKGAFGRFFLRLVTPREMTRFLISSPYFFLFVILT